MLYNTDEVKKIATDKKYGFFFGAGVEGCYGLPLGPQYTRETMLRKRNKLYDALEDFYGDFKTNKYPYSEYSKQFLFQSNSNAFREIIYRAAIKCSKKKDSEKLKFDSETEEIIGLLKEIPLNKNSKYPEKFKIKVGQLYKSIIKDYDSDNADTETTEYALLNEFSYYGSVEKDFSTIINPEKAGEHRFYRLINYFWSAYFSIIMPMLNNSDEYHNKKEYKSNPYSYVLKHLREITEYIYSEKFLNEFDSEKISNDYYKEIKKHFNPHCVITTNYTPFVTKIDIDKIYYLAGKLSNFEAPDELKIYDLHQRNSNHQVFDTKKKFIFPYLLTQAPVKPIIETGQILEYANAINSLNELDVLIILGYNINENDNHVNAILRDFILKDRKKIIYCEYVGEGKEFDKDECTDDIRIKLHLSAKYREKIIVLIHHGDAKCICDEITDTLGQKTAYANAL